MVRHAALAAPERAPFSHSDVEALRQDYLDALPIAAGILSQDQEGTFRLGLANQPFRHLVGAKSADGTAVADIPFLSAGAIGEGVAKFLAGQQTTHEFAGPDGQVGGRHFLVRLSRLRPLPTAEQRCLISLIDTTAQIETEKSLRAEMLRDSLTGLPNRLSFNEQVEALLADTNFQDGSYAVLAVDMTRFSRINESMGAIAGDEMLITFARRLFSALRARDVLARTGGDEFGVLMKLNKGIDEAVQAAERIKAALATPFRLSEHEIRLDCAIGCVLVSRNVELAEEVLRNAQFATRAAKKSGRIEIYEPRQAWAAHRRFSIETELRRAIEGEQLKLAFQPLIDLPTGKVAGFEALARWKHPQEGPIAPAEFIPVAEESGLIVPLGRWALDTALRTLSNWDKKAGRELPIYVAVNLSPIQIARDDVPTLVEKALKANKLSGKRLTLELTEGAIIQDPPRAMEVLAALKRLGVRIAVDDFGTGYTSLAYLQRLPIDVLKIDQSFVSAMLKDQDSVAIVRAVLSLANALGMAATAEGIDCKELADVLTDLGCAQGQGFYFANALYPEEAMSYWLANSA